MSRLANYLIAGILALSIISLIPAASAAVLEPAVPETRGTTASYVIASAHNYANSYTYTWPAKTVTGATQIRVHFTRLEVEATYDKVYILNSANTVIQTFGLTTATSTYATGVWSSWVTGTTLKVKLTTDSSVTKWGFATDLIEYNTGTAPTIPVLTSGVGTSGSISAAGGSQMYQITVPSGCTNMKTSVTMPSGSDFDTYGMMGAQPTTSSYTWRGYTSNNPEVVDYANPAAGVWYIMVLSYSGTGAFTITCTLTTGTPPPTDTTAPVVTISAPASGATVSGTTTISFSATDANGISSYKIKIDGTQVATTSSYSWVTTSYSNGAHTIRCEATDPSSNVGYSERSVTVSNTVVDDGGALTAGVAGNGNMDSADGADMWYIDVGASATSMYVVLTCGSADFDTFGKYNAQPTTSSYDWRGYTSGGEENTVANPAQGRHYIMVDYYSGTSSYQLTVTITYGTTPPPTGNTFKLGQTGNKYALLVGISNYKSINDLSFCDEDVNDFYSYLTTTCGYPAANIRILGDGSSTYAKTPYGTATEANYKSCLTWLAGLTDAAEIAFMTSGHGSGDGAGESYLCAWDCGAGESGQDGNFYDHEISDILEHSAAQRIFVFIDHCYSGGLGPEIMAMANKANVWMTTTCTANGYGYDEPSSSNGAWTNQFLHVTLQAHFGSSINTTMEEAFTYAASGYSHTGGDAPMQFDGSP